VGRCYIPTRKARLPTVDRLTGGTRRRLVPVERSAATAVQGMLFVCVCAVVVVDATSTNVFASSQSSQTSWDVDANRTTTTAYTSTYHSTGMWPPR